MIAPYTASKHALHGNHDNLVTYHHIHFTGYFSSLNMEFQLRQENISVVIMPLPFVYTNRAVENMKVKSNFMFEPGITSEVSNTNSW